MQELTAPSAPELDPEVQAFKPGETPLLEPQSLLAIFEELSMLLELSPAPELQVGALDALLVGLQSL